MRMWSFLSGGPSSSCAARLQQAGAGATTSRRLWCTSGPPSSSDPCTCSRAACRHIRCTGPSCVPKGRPSCSPTASPLRRHRRGWWLSPSLTRPPGTRAATKSLPSLLWRPPSGPCRWMCSTGGVMPLPPSRSRRRRSLSSSSRTSSPRSSRRAPWRAATVTSSTRPASKSAGRASCPRRRAAAGRPRRGAAGPVFRSWRRRGGRLQRDPQSAATRGLRAPTSGRAPRPRRA
mmetsp:Transcript_59932/g.190382  ORF Transcript_59932/g.190382 Transcript_59932/m.190382 type:complete len:232 (-) Transcript_59932:361-1056(-)